MLRRTHLPRHLTTLVAIALVSGFLGACQTAQPGTPEARVERVEASVDEIPDWYVSPPEKDDAVFATGTAVSGDLQLSLDKSILNAKRSLADRINSLLSSKMKSFLSETGAGEDTVVLSEVERVTTNLITEVNVSGYKRAETKIIPTGEQYRSYVLLSYPAGKADAALINQVKQNRVLESRMRASKAFQDLEKEIKEARERKPMGY